MQTKAARAPRKPGWVVPGREKIGYFLGNGANFTVHSFVSTFLSVYLLMIGVSATTSATVLLILKAWDAVNDVLFGYLIDKVRFKPQNHRFLAWLFSGRFLPWYRIAAFLLPVSAITLFTINTQAPIWMRILQYVIGYLLYDIAFTLASAPYGCMLTSLTSNVEERTFLQSYSVLGQGAGALPVSFVGTALIAGSFGYSGAAILFAVFGFLLALPTMLTVKERNVTEPALASESAYTLKEMGQFLKKSPEFLFFELGQLVWGMFFTSGFMLFLAYYIFGDANISLIYMAMGVIPTVALIPFFPILFRHVDKMVCIRIACALYALFSLVIYFIGPEGAKASLGLHYALYAVCGSTYAFTMIGSAMVLPDVAEVAKYRTNTDRIGIIFSIHAFVGKLVGSLVTSVSLLILGAYGYVSVTAGSFAELAALNAQGIGLQTPHALQGLWNVTFLFPAFGFLLAAFFYSLVRINRKEVGIMIRANLGEISREEAVAQLQQGTVEVRQS